MLLCGAVQDKEVTSICVRDLRIARDEISICRLRLAPHLGTVVGREALEVSLLKLKSTTFAAVLP